MDTGRFMVTLAMFVTITTVAFGTIQQGSDFDSSQQIGQIAVYTIEVVGLVTVIAVIAAWLHSLFVNRR